MHVGLGNTHLRCASCSSSLRQDGLFLRVLEVSLFTSPDEEKPILQCTRIGFEYTPGLSLRQNVFCTHICVCVVGLHVHIDLRLMSSIFISHSLPYYALRHAPHCTWNSWFQLVWLVSMIWLFSVSASKGLQVGCQAHAWLLCGPRACRVQSSCLYSILRRLLTLI